MPLRVRLAVIYAVLLALSLTGLGLAVYLIVDDRLSNSLDDDLQVRTQTVVLALEPVEGPLSVESLDATTLELLDNEALAGILFQVRDARGSIIYSSFQPGVRSLPLPAGEALPNVGAYYSTHVRDEPFRLQYQPITRDGELVGAVVLGQSLTAKMTALDLIRNVLVGGAIIVILLTTVSAYFLAGRVLMPVRRVSALAKDIEDSADFRRRVPVTPAGDELSELARTFNAMIERVERILASQKAFLADSSHELRRPLTIIRTDIDVLDEPGLSEEDRREIGREMKREAMLITNLIGDLLLLSREGREEMVSAGFDLSELCRDALAHLGSRDDGRHPTVAEIAPAISIVGDRERLGRALDNLLENAAAYTPDGCEIRLSLFAEEETVCITISDDGAGIPPADLPHIFERFYRGEGARSRSADHSGLGLAIAKHIVEAHGGSISVDSEVGVGTSFTIQLSRTQP